MQFPAAFIGAIVLAQGLLGLTAPAAFVSYVSVFQGPPVLYIAAVVRVAVGVVLFLAAPKSRSPMLLRVLGSLIAAGGALTPFVGVQFAEAVMRWWAEGGVQVVRGWAGISLGLGLFILYATVPPRWVSREPMP
jgi:hypothetical protein